MSLFKHKHIGVHPREEKNTSGAELRIINKVPLVRIPVAMQIGPPPKTIVKKGDAVKLGQIIAEGEAFLSVPVHASVSGTVLEVVSEVQSNGRPCDVVVIENDGKYTKYEHLIAPEVNSKEDFIAAVRASGLVGLGGAGFPTHVKLSPPPDKPVSILLINGMECEPYITSDEWLMRNYADEIIKGAELVLKWCGIEEAVIGLESNTPEAKTALETALENSEVKGKIRLEMVRSLYPQGAEKVLIKTLTGREVPSGGLPHDVGTLVLNVGTLRHIANYLTHGMPLVRRFITLDGPALNRTGIYEVPIGARICDILEAAGGLAKVPEKVIMGGPMMGVSVNNIESSIIKMNNAILVFDHEQAHLPEELPCIHCGRCIRDCPMRLMPTRLDVASRTGNIENLQAYSVNDCIECGACSFICPSKRYLVQNIRIGKQILRDHAQKEMKK